MSSHKAQCFGPQPTPEQHSSSNWAISSGKLLIRCCLFLVNAHLSLTLHQTLEDTQRKWKSNATASALKHFPVRMSSVSIHPSHSIILTSGCSRTHIDTANESELRWICKAAWRTVSSSYCHMTCPSVALSRLYLRKVKDCMPKVSQSRKEKHFRAAQSSLHSVSDL